MLCHSHLWSFCLLAKLHVTSISSSSTQLIMTPMSLGFSLGKRVLLMASSVTLFPLVNRRSGANFHHACCIADTTILETRLDHVLFDCR